ncbi:MAG TPA: phosphatidylglycerol lysyltransferase domain-containing protein, partial [Candidatus Saccharimonadales bacterium]|nr:phosphatidylglycerol lysyltransferase domain-containing protein [Candidatus Saccharimonadales bacterium]
MGGISEFPDYTSVQPSIRADIEKFTRRHKPYSDFNFNNVLSWNLGGTARVSRLNNNLALQLPDYIDGVTFYSFLGDEQVEATASTLLDEAERNTGIRRLRLVPEIGAVALADSGKFTVTEDRDGHDYTLCLPDLLEKRGAKYTHMRQELNYYTSKYGQNTAFQKLDITEPRTQAEMTQVFIGREDLKTDASPGNDPMNELRALNRLFAYADPSDMATFGLRMGSELKAFIICEKNDYDWCTGHFWKADTAYRGIYR